MVITHISLNIPFLIAYIINSNVRVYFFLLLLSIMACRGAEFSESDVNRVLDECIRKRDITLVTQWADEFDARRDRKRWNQMLPHLITKDNYRNNVLFALYARCCLFAPRDAIRLFKNDYRSSFGKIDLKVRTRFVSDLPGNIQRRYMRSQTSVVVSASLAGLGRRTSPAYVYIGIGVPGWKPGDGIKLEDIEFVNTDFDSFLWFDDWYKYPIESLNKQKDVSGEGNGELIADFS